MVNASARFNNNKHQCECCLVTGRPKMWLVLILAAFLVIAQYQFISAWVTSSPFTRNTEEVVSMSLKEASYIKSVINKLPSGSLVTEDLDNQELEKLLKQLFEICPPRPMLTIPPIPPLYVITPTYRRPEQIAELTRLAQTLMHVQNVHWLVIEDAKSKTPEVSALLRKTGLKFEHLTAPMPDSYRTKKGSKPRGVSNRNKGLQWLRSNAKEGVFYFADDDNTYDIDIFSEMRSTKKVSMWPVGLCTKTGLSTPIVKNGTFSGFFDGWIAGRKFPVDMAGFAVNVKFLLQRPKAAMPYKPGFEEDGFLKSLAPFEPSQIELKAANCTKILVWHTQTKKNEPALAIDEKKYGDTNLVTLRKQIV